MKTYSVVIKNSNGIYIVNIHKYEKLEEIDFDKVEKYCIDNKRQGYGYQYCKNSNEYHPRSIHMLKYL